MEMSWVLGGISAVIAGLTSAVGYLFKLYYVDTKQALKDCRDEHVSAKIEFKQILKDEKEDCQKELGKISAVVQEKQVQITHLSQQVFELAKNQPPPGSSIIRHDPK